MSESVYPEWKAPAGDGEFLIWPEPGRIIAETRENHGRLVSETILIQNVPLCEVRRRQRQRELPGIADDALIVASGHQTELYHAGVWAKDVLADLAARELGGTALHVAVDTDQPKHLSLRWPGNSLPITDDPNLATAEWAGMLESPTPEYLNKLRTAVARIDGFQPAVSKFFDSMVLRPPLSQVISVAMTRLDDSLGLNTNPAILSHQLDGEPYLLLTHHLLAHAGTFAHQYNAALSAYRSQHNVHSTMRPMPDLPLGADECETPFWLDHLTSGLRQRATVRRINNRWSLTAPSNDRFEFDASLDGWLAAEKLKTFLATHELRLSPRALTLTLYLRLLLVDQFIHGIGGGRYDQVTDALISSHFGITPPNSASPPPRCIIPPPPDELESTFRTCHMRAIKSATAPWATKNAS
jgi:hypothetical protein